MRKNIQKAKYIVLETVSMMIFILALHVKHYVKEWHYIGMIALNLTDKIQKNTSRCLRMEGVIISLNLLKTTRVKIFVNYRKEKDS